jgi:ribonuclease HIII
MANMYSVEVTREQVERLRSELLERGFEFSQPAHTYFAAKGLGVSCAAYLSGKLVVQGKGAQELMEFLIEPEILGSVGMNDELQLTPRIGQDESGKGDFFGPLTIAAVCAGHERVRELVDIGVKDSKTLSEQTIKRLAAEIRRRFPHTIVSIGPERYNSLYDNFKNLNRLLAWGHATAAAELLKEQPVKLVVIDQFAAPQLVERALAQKQISISVHQRPRAESDPVVAAASILARDAFVRSLHNLGEQVGLTLPKGGASPQLLAVGRQLLAKHGLEIFSKIAKVHFSTLKQIQGLPVD